MVPPRQKKSEHSLDILRGKCPTTTPFVIATEYRSAAFRGSLSHCTTSPIAGSHISLHIWCPRMHDSLRSSSMIVHVLVNNNNLFPCLEIIGVFNFRTDARIQKFFDAKIFGHENFRIYGTCSHDVNIRACQIAFLFYSPLSADGYRVDYWLCGPE